MQIGRGRVGAPGAASGAPWGPWGPQDQAIWVLRCPVEFTSPGAAENSLDLYRVLAQKAPGLFWGSTQAQEKAREGPGLQAELQLEEATPASLPGPPEKPPSTPLVAASCLHGCPEGPCALRDVPRPSARAGSCWR